VRSHGAETVSVVLQLPAYAQLERDYRGAHALLELLAGLFGLSLELDKLRDEGERQYAEVDHSVRQDSRLKAWVQEMEAAYDSEAASRSEEEPPKLSPELERFLRDVESRWDGPGQN
jgi:predicted ATP-grasp superfamily ATP-dependent carboligase